MVEYDEAYVGKSTKAQVVSKLKRGRGTQKSQKWLQFIHTGMIADNQIY